MTAYTQVSLLMSALGLCVIAFVYFKYIRRRSSK